jgi:hypothetical protein
MCSGWNGANWTRSPLRRNSLLRFLPKLSSYLWTTRGGKAEGRQRPLGLPPSRKPQTSDAADGSSGRRLAWPPFVGNGFAQPSQIRRTPFPEGGGKHHSLKASGRLQMLTRYLSGRAGLVPTCRPLRLRARPYFKGKKSVRVDGPQVLSEPTLAQAVAINLHELATNAAKYGALSATDGRIDLHWCHEPNGELSLRWAETGGPSVRNQHTEGLACGWVKALIAQQEGKVRSDWRAGSSSVKNHGTDARGPR